MEDTAAFSAVLQRSAPVTRRRVLVVLFALGKYAKRENTELSPSAIMTLLEYVMVGKPVRFLFASGAGGSVLRSHDRGFTWRVVYRIHDNVTDVVPTGRQPAGTLGAVGETKALSETGGNIASKDEVIPPSAVEPENHTSCIATMDDRVAVCGDNGFLAVSVDRGLSFSKLAKEAFHPLGEGGSNNESNCSDFRGVEFLSECALVFFSKRHLFRCPLNQKSYNSVEFGDISLLQAFSDPIGCVRTFSRAGRGCMRELFVATNGFVHYSHDGGAVLLKIPHKLGVIRSIEPMDVVLRRREIPQLPPSLIDAMTAPAVERHLSAEKEKYSYSVVVRATGAQDKGVGDSGCDFCEGWVDGISLPHRLGSVCYRVLLVAGCGANILPYDCTALLFVAASSNGPDTTPDALGSLAEHVDYVPYIKSGITEPLSVALTRRPGSGGCVFARSNIAGVSFSSDMGRSWSIPKQAYVVSVLASDGGEFVCCNRRNVVNFPNSVCEEVHALQTDLRVPFLTDIAMMT